MKATTQNRWIFQLAALLFTAFLSLPALAQIEWPQEIEAEEGTIVVYQPQPDKLTGDLLTGRAAISLELKDQDGPIFGAMWYTARIETDREANIATVRDFKVDHVTWPDSKDAGEQRFTAIVEGSIPDAGFEISLDRLSASLANAEIEQKSLEQLKTDPPQILFSQELAVLLLYDGKPRFSPIENSPYERALNTPFAVAHNTKTKMNYLSSGTFWYEAKILWVRGLLPKPAIRPGGEHAQAGQR